MTTPRILTVGSMAFDSIETPAGKAEKVLGGSVNYFALAASFFTPLRVIGVVGDDFPVSHLEWLKGRGIDTTGVERASGETFHWVGRYGEDMNEAVTLSTRLNVFERFKPRLDAEQKSTPYLFLANIDPSLQDSVLDQMNEPRLVVADSMNFWITGKPDALRRTLRRVDVLSINEGEAMLLSGRANLVQAVGAILELGPSVLIVKRGEYGAAVFTRDWTSLVPAYPLDRIVDPTGAGDSFAGAFVGYLAREGIERTTRERNPAGWRRALRQAAIEGCVLASFTVEDFSIHRLQRLEPKELRERKARFLSMISFE